ncbi:hypothetical protein [Amycolatopsis sp. NPDC003731]
MLQTIIGHTLRVPRAAAPAGDGSAVARQLDVVLLSVGFKADRALLGHLSTVAPGAAMDLAAAVVGAVRGLVGDHVRHNAYFKKFPRRVPDTVEFWVSCLRHTGGGDVVDLLTLPGYGRYQHSFADLLAAHDELVASIKDRVTVVHLGGTLEEETRALYRSLAESGTPLGEADLQLLAELAVTCGDVELEAVPVRENRAVLNAVRLAEGRPLVAVDTVVDVLRAACQASGGDVTLAEPTRFRSFRRRERRVLLAALDGVIAGNAGKLGDVSRFAERFKRLGSYLHPYETTAYPGAREVFDVARGDRKVSSVAGRAERAFADGDVSRAAEVLTAAPGLFMRSLDRLLRQADPVDDVLAAAGTVLGSVSGRVLCSVREHLVNRATPDAARVFTTRSRRAWVAADTRPPLPREVIARVSDLIDAELSARLPAGGRLVVDPAVLDVALPLSGKASEDGFAVLPRGSRTHVEGEVLRFFTYWRQARETTDFDLSALLLDARFRYAGHVSWTNYHDGGAVYSGDLTEAPDGATEFIDIPLDSLGAAYVVPQVNVFSGEGFDDVAESMFGWMLRDRAQAGAPFEPRTVRTRSDLRGRGRVALPMVFGRDRSGTWTATWLHLYLSGSPRFNRLETNQASTSVLARGLVERKYLTVGYLVGLMRDTEVTVWEPGARPAEPVTYVGLHRPEGLPEGSTVLTLETLNRLVPA